MLEYIRNKAKGWLAYAIVGLICIPFALWGIGDYLGYNKPPIAATINGEEISEHQIELIFQRLKAQNENPLSVNEQDTKNDILESLVKQKLITQFAADEGFTVSEQQINRSIKQNQAFYVDGKFSQERLARILRSNGFSIDSYVEELKRNMLQEQINNIFTATNITTENEAKAFFKLLNQTRDIRYAIIKKELFTPKLKLTKADIENYYEKNQESFRKPELVSLEYIELNPENLAKEVTIDVNAAQKYYQDNIQNFAKAEERQLAHILIADNKDKALKQDQITKTYNTIKKSLSEGAAFSALAKKHSVDVATKNDHGNLGWFSKEDLPEDFANAAFGINKIGEHTELVVTEHGAHIIKLLDKKNSKTPEFAELKPTIIEDLTKQATNDLIFDKKEQLETLAYETPESLESAAIELDVAVKSTKLFSKETPPETFTNLEVLNKIFSDEILIDRYNSDVIQLSDNHYLSFRVKEHEPSAIPNLKDIYPQVENHYKAIQLQALAKAFIEELTTKLNKAKAAEQARLLSTENIKLLTQSKLARNQSKIATEMVNEAFKSQTGSFKSSELDDGNFAIYIVDNVTTPKKSKLDDSEKLIYQSMLNYSRAQIDQELVLRHIKEQADIEKIADYEPNT